MAEDLPPLLVEADGAWRASRANALEVVQERADREGSRPGGSPDGPLEEDSSASVAALQLFHHEGSLSPAPTIDR